MSVNNSSPDLTQHAPRSPRLRLGGYALLPRIVDKGRASLAGKLGAYHYRGVGMDRHFFKPRQQNLWVNSGSGSRPSV